MKKILQSSFLAAAIIGSSATGALADLALYDWAFNIDGTVTTDFVDDYNLTGMPVTGALDAGTQLGSLSWTTSAVGDHSFLAFFDYEITETGNTWFNEYGSVTGTAAEGQSWEIDEPGFDLLNPGDIYTNFESGNLDYTNGVPIGSPDDVSMAMGWDFTLAADQTALITLILGAGVPTSGFYLSHVDSDTGQTIYFSSNLTITNGTKPVPEPATMLLMGAGLAGLLGVCRKKGKIIRKSTER